MTKRVDLTGKEINGLIFLSYSHTDHNYKACWNIKCYCGNTFVRRANDIKTGDTSSCGCLLPRHNLSGVPEYNIWNLIKARCYNINNPRYIDYGGRGITVCDTWLNDFTIFYRDMGPRPSSKHSIERKDNNGNYCKDNCIWETSKNQARNKRNNVLLTYNNETKTTMEWAEQLNIPYNTLRRRIIRGWSDEKALTTPVRKWPSQL